MTTNSEQPKKAPLPAPRAYDEGYAAGLAGESPLGVPYEQGSAEFPTWVDGWTDGRWEKARAARSGAP
ncbi:MAG: ribosome modulation factor [Roseiarcus sp.]